MGKETGISWTSHTFNPWWGCTKVSPGCDNCYAETLDARWGDPHWGKGVPRRIFGAKHWAEPLAWNAAAMRAGKSALVFCASMADVMDDEAPVGQRERLWELIDNTPNLIWQLLTKRPQRYMRYLPKEFKYCNVWLGMSAENQKNFEIRADHLIDASIDRGTVAFISYEPALGPLTLSTRPNWQLDWLICGAESGANRRPMEKYWVENIQKECAERGTKFFMKQFGARTPEEGARLIPAELLIREFPEE
jgi:protein gp37